MGFEKIKKVISLLLCTVICFSGVPVAANEAIYTEAVQVFEEDEFIVEGYTGGPVEDEESLPYGGASFDATTPGLVTPNEATKRLKKLAELFKANDKNELDNLYFTVNQLTCSEGSHPGANNAEIKAFCNNNCLLSLILEEDWLKKLIGVDELYLNAMPGQYLPNGDDGGRDGYQCYAFANFAMWYTFAQKNTDKVSSVKIAQSIPLTYENMQKYGVLPGDVLRTGTKGNGQHSMVVMSYDETGLIVLDCNAIIASEDNTSCRVHVRKVLYSHEIVTVTGAQNYLRKEGQESIEYTVSYDANGGSGEPASQTKRYGETLKLSETVPVKEGYTFLGWVSKGVSDVLYAPGSDYSENMETTLQAVWKYTTPPAQAKEAGSFELTTWSARRNGKHYEIYEQQTDFAPGEIVGFRIEMKENPGTNKFGFKLVLDNRSYDFTLSYVSYIGEGLSLKFEQPNGKVACVFNWENPESHLDVLAPQKAVVEVFLPLRDDVSLGTKDISFVLDEAFGSTNALGENLVWETGGTTAINITDGSCTVTVSGEGKNDTTAEQTAVMGEPFTFTVNKDANYDYTVTSNHTLKDNGDGSYTIEKVTKNITINVEKTVKQYNVTVTGNGSDDVTANKKADSGAAFTFSVNKKVNYNYTVTSNHSLKDNGDGTYTIAKVTGDVTVEVKRTEKAIKLGDVTGDGKVTVRDAMLVYDYCNGVYTFTDEQHYAADLNGDGSVTKIEAAHIYACLNVGEENFEM